MSASAFQHREYLIRRKVFRLFGGAFHIFDPSDNVVMYSEMKAFKLKEDIRLYSGEDKQSELLVIKARNILDFSATYDISDPATQEAVGALRRRGIKSMLKDEWVFLDTQDREIGVIQEDNLLLALIRRFLTDLIPQHFSGSIGDQAVCEFRQNFNPFVQKITLDFTPDTRGLLDRRLGLAAAVLLCAIEGRQE